MNDVLVDRTRIFSPAVKLIALSTVVLLATIVFTNRFLRMDASANPPPGFYGQTLLTGLVEPTSLDFTPDGRMFIVERAGRILILQPGAVVVDPQPLLILDNVDPNLITGGQGVITILVDPDFSSNGYIYLFYSALAPQRDRVSRFTVVGNTADPGSELIIWEDKSDRGRAHLGGGLAFGPDGYFYISTGDHHDNLPGPFHTSQRLDTRQNSAHRPGSPDTGEQRPRLLRSRHGHNRQLLHSPGQPI